MAQDQKIDLAVNGEYLCLSQALSLHLPPADAAWLMLHDNLLRSSLVTKFWACDFGGTGMCLCVNNSFTLHIYLSISHLTDLTWRLLSSGSFTLSSVIMNHKFYLVIEGVSHFYNCALSTTSPIILQMWTRYFFEGFYHLQL